MLRIIRQSYSIREQQLNCCRRAEGDALNFTSVFCNLISFQLGPGELGMLKTYYTQNTSDYRTVSKKIRCAKKARKLQICVHLTGRFTLSVGLKIYRTLSVYFQSVTFFLPAEGSRGLQDVHEENREVSWRRP